MVLSIPIYRDLRPVDLYDFRIQDAHVFTLSSGGDK
jgi:hypothetical protein